MENITNLTIRRIFKTLVVLGMLTFTLGTATRNAKAQNLLLNPSFESPTLAPGGLTVNFTSVGAWTVLGSSVLHIETTFSEPTFGMIAYNAQHGLNAVDLTGRGDVNTTGITQSISTVVGQVYNVSFYVGRAGGTTSLSAATADFSIDNGATRTSFTNSGLTPGFVNWQQFTTSFMATSAATSISFYNRPGPIVNGYVGLDNVSVTAASAPEPTTLVLLALGSITIIGKRRQCRK